MPTKKRSRAAKPVLSNITNQKSAAQAKEHQIKLDLIVEDYRKNATLCMEQIKEEKEQIMKSLQEIYANYHRQLEPLSKITVSQLLASEQTGKRSRRSKKESQAIEEAMTITLDEKPATTLTVVEESDEPDESTEEQIHADVKIPDKKPAAKDSRISDISALLAETSNAMSEVRRPKRKAAAVPASATRSSTRNCKPPVGSMPAPSTARAVRSKKNFDGPAFITPAGQRIFPNGVGSKVLVTPKFDPRVPLPPGTVRRRPLPNEVPMSLTGSPLKISPPKPQLKEIMSSFLDTLEKEVPQVGSKEFQHFHAVLDKFIERRPSDPTSK